MRGKLITLDGPDGCGKSTQIKILKGRLEQAGYAVETLREPGDTVLGEKLREILLHSTLDLDTRAEVLLFSAARAQIHAEKILPLLKRGYIVLTDRWAWSTMAYQGDRVSQDDITAITRFATGGIWPDLAIIIDLDPATAFKRIDRALDRFESRGLEYHNGVAARYKALPPVYTTHIDGDLDRGEISNRIYSAVIDLVGNVPNKVSSI